MTDLYQILDSYLDTRHAMGYKLEHVDRRLRQFVDLLTTRGGRFITAKLALEWAMQPTAATPKWWAKRLSLVHQFAKHAHAFDPRNEIPPCDLIPYPHERFEPYVYSQDDIQKLLDAARSLRNPLIAATYTTLLGLLAVTGMRVSEVIKLDRRDIDSGEGVLTVRMTKFGKSRELPLQPSTMQALAAYARTRDRLLPLQRSSSFLLSRAGTRLIYKNVHERFYRLVDRAGLADRRPHRPRIHDLRHTFAIRTLINWYRAGVEVAPRLPLLSTYMGHCNPSSTYWYLTAVPELLALVYERAERSQENRP